jgi:glycerol-3-phosphate cytidylyltransferase-like family protein
MGRKKKKSNRYWTKITEGSISAYNRSAENPVLKEKIYRRFIFPAFMKLSENLINKMKCEYIDSSFKDLQTDLVTYLTIRLDKFNPNAGKAYSYYTRTSFNYLIAENQKGYSLLKKTTEPINIDEQRNVMTEMHNTEMAETLKYFMDAYVEYCYNNINSIFTNQTDIHVADSILHIFEDRENIEQFNKKALYVFIRERTGLETNNITKVIKVLKHIYSTKFLEYEQTEFVNLPF